MLAEFDAYLRGESREWEASSSEVEYEDSNGPDVDLVVVAILLRSRSFRQDDLRRHELHGSNSGDTKFVELLWDNSTLCCVFLPNFGEIPSMAHVRQLEDAVLVDENVRWLHVSVGELGIVVQEVEDAQHLVDNEGDRVFSERPFAAQDLLEVAALHQHVHNVGVFTVDEAIEAGQEVL